LQPSADDLTGGLHPLRPEIFTAEGEATNEATATFLREYMTEFRDHIVRVLAVLPR
jgi:chromate reductase